MADPRPHVLRTALAAATLVAVVAGACAGDDVGDDDADGAEARTSTTATTAPASTSPAGPEGWWCHPDQADDPCLTADLRTTIVDWQLTESIDEAPAAEDPVADCFYVPPASPFAVPAGGGEVGHYDPDTAAEWVRIEAARFRTVCRVFVPVLTDARYEQVAAAFDRYLADADDRPFVLIGHQEGGDLLTRLVQERIASDPMLPARLVSAILVGNAGAQVTSDGTPGGTFPTLPLCSRADQTGCVITFHAYEDGTTPVAGEPPFGDVAPTNQPACTNPAGLEGSRGQLRAATFPVSSSLAPPPVVAGLPPVETPFVTLPEYYLAECLSLVAGTVELWIGRSIDPDDRRVPGPLAPAMRAHDLTLALGDLLHIAGEQSEAFADR